MPTERLHTFQVDFLEMYRLFFSRECIEYGVPDIHTITKQIHYIIHSLRGIYSLEVRRLSY